MSPRPRTVSDIDILTATHRVISRLGPNRFTLADVAKESGLSPATLVQRFGSKRGLLLALAKLGKDSVGACFDAARSANRSPLDALLAAATEMTRHVKSPEELANGLAFLQSISAMRISTRSRSRTRAASRRATARYWMTPSSRVSSNRVTRAVWRAQ